MARTSSDIPRPLNRKVRSGIFFKWRGEDIHLAAGVGNAATRSSLLRFSFNDSRASVAREGEATRGSLRRVADSEALCGSCTSASAAEFVRRPGVLAELSTNTAWALEAGYVLDSVVTTGADARAEGVKGAAVAERPTARNDSRVRVSLALSLLGNRSDSPANERRGFGGNKPFQLCSNLLQI